MREFVNYLLFGWYPYVCITVLILGSILRFDREQYSWRSQSSQFLRRRQMRWGSNLFHVGVLVLVVGHVIGLLTPINVFDFAGVKPDFKQVMALVIGGVAGLMAFVGCSLLLHRRLADPRIRKTSSWADIGVLALLWVQILIGLMTTVWTLDHLDGNEMLKFMAWAQGLYRLNPGAAELILDAYFIYKLHIVLGLTLFLITPFTRLVHIWSAPVWYLGRRGYQVVRSKRQQAPHPPRGAGSEPPVVRAQRPRPGINPVPAE